MLRFEPNFQAALSAGPAKMEASGAAPPGQGLLRRESSRLASVPRADYTGTPQLRGKLTVKLLQQRSRLAQARSKELQAKQREPAGLDRATGLSAKGSASKAGGALGGLQARKSLFRLKYTPRCRAREPRVLAQVNVHLARTSKYVYVSDEIVAVDLDYRFG